MNYLNRWHKLAVVTGMYGWYLFGLLIWSTVLFGNELGHIAMPFVVFTFLFHSFSAFGYDKV